MFGYSEAELRAKKVPESYIREYIAKSRDHVGEIERDRICPECGGSVKLTEWPDFVCENGHRTNVNFLEERLEEAEILKRKVAEFKEKLGEV